MAQRESDREPQVLTRTAYDRLQAELEELTTRGRSRMSERLQQAREHGDIRENAEYDAAKNEQGLMEARIRTLQRLLKDAEIVDAPDRTDRAGAGMLVVLRPLDEDDPDEETYLLAMSAEERAPGVRTITPESPLGSVIVGKAPGERVTYAAPGGKFSYEIVGLRPSPG